MFDHGTWRKRLTGGFLITDGAPSAKQGREGNMKNAKRIIEKFDSWKYDIYENNRSTWTNQDDSDVLEIEKLLEQQASEQEK